MAHADPHADPHADAVALGASVLRAQAGVLASLADSLGASFADAVQVFCACAARGGTVLVTGLGKSGLVGAKISATLASLGTPSHSVHPSEAAHGDLGRFRPTDSVLALSHSGETAEVVALAAILRQDKLPIVSITGGEPDEHNSLVALSTVAMRLGSVQEAGSPDFLAPTSSTTATLALGDALALAIARKRSFTDAQFAKRHPGGAIGGLLRPVCDVLRFAVGRNLPLIPDDVSVAEALQMAAAEARRPGALLLVCRETGALTGIFTDGDLRRLVLREPAALNDAIADRMTRNPKSLPSSALVRDAAAMFMQSRQDEIPVVDEAGCPVGLLDVQDLIAMRLVNDA